MKLKDVYRLLVTVFVSASFAVGCTNNAEKKANNERKQLAAERAKVSQLTTEAEQKKKEIEAIEADLKQKMEALSGEKAEWDQNRSARELEITNLSATLAGKKEELTKVEDDIKKLTAQNAAETASIEAERASLEEAKKKTESEIATLKSQSETEAKTKLDEAQKALDIIKEQQQTLEAREIALKASEAANLKAQSALTELQISLKAAEQRLQNSVQESRALFARDGLGDVFDKLQENKRMKFLVSIVGRGSDKYAEKLQNELNVINQGDKSHSRITSKPPKAGDSYVVDNSMIVDAQAGVVKKFRDDANAFLESENKSGVAASSTSLFVVARPIQKIRVGMKLTVRGSKAAGFEKRNSGVIMELNQVRSIESKLLNIDDVKLNNPGEYVFASDADGRKCKNIDLECLKVLKDKGLLESQNVFTVGNSTTKITNREALTEALSASINQMNIDYELYSKGLAILAIDYTMEDGLSPRLNTDSVKKLGSIWLGLGETRAPIIDQLELSYRIVMIDEIGNAGNHIDAWKYMSSGVIQNVQMFAADRSRNEIEIQLPVGNLKSSTFTFDDLGLSDYKLKTVKPQIPTEALKKLEGNVLSTDMNGGDQNALAEAGRYRKAYKTYKDDVKKEKISVYKDRLKTNMGMQQIYVRTLQEK
ncbi:MAG: hypothetical protein AB7N80_12800 [Bdellovibrionales bacterium]